jgi:hypothetical protein
MSSENTTSRGLGKGVRHRRSCGILLGKVFGKHATLDGRRGEERVPSDLLRRVARDVLVGRIGRARREKNERPGSTSGAKAK